MDPLRKRVKRTPLEPPILTRKEFLIVLATRLERRRSREVVGLLVPYWRQVPAET